MSAGEEHSVVLTEGGRVHSFGWWLGGRLGHDEEQSEPVPRIVVALAHVRVVEVAAGAFHTAVLTASGEVICLGGMTEAELLEARTSDEEEG